MAYFENSGIRRAGALTHPPPTPHSLSPLALSPVNPRLDRQTARPPDRHIPLPNRAEMVAVTVAQALALALAFRPISPDEEMSGVRLGIGCWVLLVLLNERCAS